MTVTGGLRLRLLVDSLHQATTDALRDLGWFDAGRMHLPITVLSGPNDLPGEPINVLVIGVESLETTWIEMGSDLNTDRLAVDCVFYAEHDTVGIHLINDLRDAMRGRITSHFTLAGSFPLLDFRLATPTPIGYAQVVAATSNRRMPTSSQDYQRHIHTLECVIHDTYYAEGEFIPPPPVSPGDVLIDSEGTALVDESSNLLIWGTT